MAQNIAWYILTCHMCQVRKTQQVLIPLTVAMPAPLFLKVYMDTMHMPPSSGYKYIVQGRCSLTYWPEWAMLYAKNAKSLARWILNDIIYRWGLLLEIVTDNGSAFLKALKFLEKHYHIKHIRISGYNSRANGLVERSHFEVREALFKACDGNESKWSATASLVFWAKRVTIRRRMGCSPYFAATGSQGLISCYQSTSPKPIIFCRPWIHQFHLPSSSYAMQLLYRNDVNSFQHSEKRYTKLGSKQPIDSKKNIHTPSNNSISD